MTKEASSYEFCLFTSSPFAKKFKPINSLAFGARFEGVLKFMVLGG